ncbi:MAG: di-trans,poly-cis-decaprenylcistransferase [Treponema sp.]|nr:di-trans,poly-cis-decaprenylcistransferase [Treponema sp.]
MDRETLPVHVGIIMDGNGRWAVRQSLARTQGHAEGVKRAKEIVRAASDCGIPYVTLYIFSTENWKRTQEETGFLMNLIHQHLRAEFAFYKKHRIRLLHLGDRTGLPQDIRADIDAAVAETERFTGTTLVMAINYGGRDEIVRGIRQLVLHGTTPDAVDERTVTKSLDIPTLPDVDLLIRTGGELRLSNFLLWHAPYAELIFTETLWPDYTEAEFYANIATYQKRQRRFGAVFEGTDL